MVCAEFGMVRLSDRSRQLIHWCTASLFRLWAQGLIMILKLRFRRDFEAEVWSVFCRWGFVEVMKLNLGRDSEARFGQDFGDAVVWLRSWCFVEILKMTLIKICVWTCAMTLISYFGKMNSTLGSVVPLAMFQNITWRGFSIFLIIAQYT